MDHVRLTHTECDAISCNICDLFICSVCGGAEGSLATECPGFKITAEQQDSIYSGVHRLQRWDLGRLENHPLGNLLLSRG